jgi:SsrA-binding protein
MSKDTPEGMKIVAQNRRAGFDYELGERFEAGISLTGAEIKSVRAGKMDLRDAFVSIRADGAWLINAFIAPYEQAKSGFLEYDENRERRLLLHKREMDEIDKGVGQKGFTAIATKAYLKKGRAKVEVALARGKKNFDKRAAIAKRDSQRDIARAIANG